MKRETAVNMYAIANMRCIDNSKATYSLEVGAIYNIRAYSLGRNPDMCDVYKDCTFVGYYELKRFAPVRLARKYPMEEFKASMDLIGTQTTLEHGVGTVVDATILMDVRQLYRPYVTSDMTMEFERDGFCVVLAVTYHGTMRYIPLSAYSAPPKNKDLTLNDEYNATVYMDKVVVGCQTFPAQTLYDLVALHKELLEANNIKH